MEEELYFVYNSDDDPCEEDTREKNPLNAEETLAKVIEVCLQSLQEMLVLEKDGALPDYAEGAKSAYVEILQFVQQWEKKGEYGLDFNLESVFRVK